MIELRTPGVYVQSVEVPPTAPFRLSVAGFVGLAERGPLNNPQALTNWGQYRDVFGGFVGYSYLPYVVWGFFVNGGERCWVVRVAHESATRAALEVADGAGTAALRLEALDPGAWGDRLEVTLVPTSTGDLLLTRLAEGVAAGATIARVGSVAGIDPGDTVTLVHPRDQIGRAHV